jgi:tetratricopeptide (TPR) repeat protein
MVQQRKRKKDTPVSRQPPPESATALDQRGKLEFGRGDYAGAVRSWEQARQRAAGQPALLARLTAALVEAHFRRGVTASPPNLDDLERALALSPAEPRLRYHLARAYHLWGRLDEAEALYRELLARKPPYARAAWALAQALVARRQLVPADPVWQLLSAEEQARLGCVQALLHRRSPPAWQQAPRHGADALWTGLAGVALNRPELTSALQAALDDGSLPRRAAGVAHYYLGIARWVENDQAAALQHWLAASQAGLQTDRLRQNLAACYLSRALRELRPGDPPAPPARPPQPDQLERAALAIQPGLQLAPHDPSLLSVKAFVLIHQGYAAALAGRWPAALDYWQQAEQIGGAPGRALIVNLALACEKTENYAEAAERWRAVLRRRPRKAGVPDALSDTQVARMWQHVAENYRKAGNYAEATQTYRTALKWSPDNLDLQLSLVEALLADGRARAALSVIEPAVAAHPDHVEALAWQAQVYEALWYTWNARKAWQRVLKLDPQHPRARLRLAHLYEIEGDQRRHVGAFSQALGSYEQALLHWPANGRLVVSIGLCHAGMQNIDAARRQFERALALDARNLEVRFLVIRAWLQLNCWPDARALLEQTDRLEPAPPPGFYMDLAEFCQMLDQTEWAMHILELARPRYPDDPQLLVAMAVVLGEHQQAERAIAYLRRAVKLDPNLAAAHLWLGNLYYAELQQPRLAARHWHTAEQLARQTNDLQMLLYIRVNQEFFRRGRTGPSPKVMADLMGPFADSIDFDDDEDDEGGARDDF